MCIEKSLKDPTFGTVGVAGIALEAMPFPSPRANFPRPLLRNYRTETKHSAARVATSSALEKPNFDSFHQLTYQLSPHNTIPVAPRVQKVGSFEDFSVHIRLGLFLRSTQYVPR